MNRGTQINIWYVLLAVMGVVFLRDIWVQSQTVETIPYSQFETYLDQGAIKEVTVGETTIRGTFTSAQDGKTGFMTTPVTPDLADRLNEAGVTYSGAVENTWFKALLSWVLPALFSSLSGYS